MIKNGKYNFTLLSTRKFVILNKMAEAERLPHAIPFRLPEAAVTDHGEGAVARELRKKAEPKRRALAVLKAVLSRKSTKRSHAITGTYVRISSHSDHEPWTDPATYHMMSF